MTNLSTICVTNQSSQSVSLGLMGTKVLSCPLTCQSLGPSSSSRASWLKGWSVNGSTAATFFHAPPSQRVHLGERKHQRLLANGLVVWAAKPTGRPSETASGGVRRSAPAAARHARIPPALEGRTRLRRRDEAIGRCVAHRASLYHVRRLGSLNAGGRPKRAGRLFLLPGTLVFQAHLPAEECAQRRRLPVVGPETDASVRSKREVSFFIIRHSSNLLGD